jgi:tetratricopeptide (TPR) repeat protein
LAAFGAPNTLPAAENYIQVCRAATGAGEEAVDVLNKRLASIPLTPGGGVDQWSFLGYAYEKSGRIAEAMEILNRCREANPAYSRAGLTLNLLGQQVTSDRDKALSEADAALRSGDKDQAIKKLAEAYRLTAAGPKKEEIRKAMLKMAAGMDPAPSLTNEAQDHYLRGNAALKAAKSPMDLGRSLSEFQWAVFYSPWVGDLYFNTSAVKKLQNQTAAAVSDLKLYLTANANAKNIEELLNRLYEFDYQREQKLRELAAAATF